MKRFDVGARVVEPTYGLGSVIAVEDAYTRVQFDEHGVKKFLTSINQWLEEPLEDCLAVAHDGSPCLESKSPVDIEESLGMYHGNIFQDAPTWPFAAKKEHR